MKEACLPAGDSLENMDERSSALKTDLYELTMAAGYFSHKVNLSATFELFCHKALSKRSYFIACGLEQAVTYLLNLKFLDVDISRLKKHPALRWIGQDFFDYLKGFKFTGDLWAMPEGTPFFPFEPIIQVKAPIIEAQILETYLLSTIHIQTLVATKASRVARAASSDARVRQVIEFGARRAHGPEAGVLAARAAYIAGCAGTSNVFAGLEFGIPVYGTMAHSWIQTFEDEEEAFKKYNQTFPAKTILLLDTYDTIKAAKTALRLKKQIQAVRLDSGDLYNLSRRVRKILDKAGLARVKIIASGDLDESKILQLVEKRAPIDIFGVGTRMVTSADLPFLDIVYKLVETESPEGIIKYKVKLSAGKRTLPGRKQVYRYSTDNGVYAKDIICLAAEKPEERGRAMLEPIIQKGRLIKELPSIHKIRKYAQQEISRLPESCISILSGGYLKTEISRALKTLNNNL